MTFYLSTEGSSWNDNEIITARAMSGYGGTISLTAKRGIKQEAQIDTGNFGLIYLWGEITDLSYTSAADVRLIVETWGYFIEFEENSWDD